MSFVNPIGSGLTQGRIDQGVDYQGSGNLYALGSGTIVATHNSGWPGLGTFIALKLDNPSGAMSPIVYYAEDITPAVKVGQRVTAGQIVGRATGGSTGIEVGWGSTAIGAALAHGASGVTNEGQNFFNLVKSLGGIGGGGTSATPNATLTSFDPTGIGALASSFSNFFGQFGDMFTLFHNVISPGFWLRVGMFFAGIFLLAFGVYALVKADSDSGLMPSNIPIPVPV